MPDGQTAAAAARAPSPAVDGAMARRWLGLVLLLSGSFLTILDVFIVNVAIPRIRSDLGASFAEVELVIAVYSLAYAVSLVTGGRLGDTYGRRRVFMVGMAAFAVASALCGLAPSPSALVAARLVQGVSAALVFPQVLAIIRVSFEGDDRRKAFAAMGAVAGGSAIAGQLFGGLLVEFAPWDLGWRSVFLVNLPVVAVVLPFAGRLIPESRADGATRLDVIGALLGAFALALLVYPLVEGRQAGWPAWAFVSLAAALPAAGLFAWYERRLSRRGGAPVLDIALFRDRGFVAGVALFLVLYSTLNSFFLAIALLLQVGIGLSPFAAGMIVTPSAVVFAVVSFQSARVVGRFGTVALEVAAVVSAATFGAIAGYAAWAGGGTEPLVLAALLLVFGISNALLVSPMLNVVLSAVADHHAGMAAGAIATMQQVGGALGVAVVGAIFLSTLERAGGVGPDAYAGAFWTAALYNAAAMLAVWLLVRRVRSAARKAA